MIFQEMSLIPTLTVAQNVFLTREAKSGFGLIDDRTAERRAPGALRRCWTSPSTRARWSAISGPASGS